MVTNKNPVVLTAVFVTAIASVAMATPLTGSGSHLPVPTAGPPAREPRVPSGNVVAGPWQGTWSPPALAPWIGTFSVEGPLPAGVSNNAGVSRYTFAGLPGGVLPAGTFFYLGDVDGGSTTAEAFELTAYQGGSQLTGAWLDEPIGASNSPTSSQMPSYSLSGGIYRFDGSTVAGNPNVAVYMVNNAPLTELFVNRASEWANFALSAPIPEPGALTVLAMGGFALLGRRREER